MMLIAAINLSYSKTFIVVDSQWIGYLSEIQSLPLLLLQRKDKIFLHHPYDKGEPMGDFSATQCSTAIWCAIQKLPVVPEFS